MTKPRHIALSLMVGLLFIWSLSSCGKSKKQKMIDNYIKLVDQFCACTRADQESTNACFDPIFAEIWERIQAGTITMDLDVSDPVRMMKKYKGSARMVKAMNRQEECSVAGTYLPCKAVDLPPLSDGVVGHSLRPPGLSVWISDTGISIQGNRDRATGDCQTIKPWPPRARDDYLIPQFQKAIKTRFDGADGAERTAYLYVDQEVSFELLSKVIYTLAMEQYLEHTFMGRSGDRYAVVFEPHMPRIRIGKQKESDAFGWYPSLSIGTSSIGATVSIVDPAREKLEKKDGDAEEDEDKTPNTLHIKATDGSCPAITRGSDGSIDPAQLDALLAGICDRTHDTLLLGPDPDVPLKDLLLLVRAAARNSRCTEAITLTVVEGALRADCTSGTTLDRLDADLEELVRKKTTARMQRLSNRDQLMRESTILKVLGSPGVGNGVLDDGNRKDVFSDALVGGIGSIGGKSPAKKGTAVGLGSRVKRTSDIKLGPVKLNKNGTFDRNQIKKVIRRNMASLRWCYEKTLKRDPKLQGKLVISFEISPTGLVRDAKITRSTAKDTQFESCIMSRIGRLRFPASKDGAAQKVSFPFVFKPIGKL